MDLFKVFFTVFFICYKINYCINVEQNVTGSHRQKKLFSLFNIVTFKNDPCTGRADPSTIGTCYTSTECNSRSGTVDGNCAAGFGVCCTFLVDVCGSSVSQNCTYIQSPNYPTTYSTAGSCAFTVYYSQSDICQIRLDFTFFDITETTAGVCTDSFAVTTPTGRDPPTLCGTNTGQHLYFETGSTTTATTLAFTIATTGGGSWRIKITQIECQNRARAPFDCAQYFTGAGGSFESYNFAGGVQLQNIQYTICIRQELGFCGIEYRTQDGTSPDTFALSDDATPTQKNGGAIATGEAMGYFAIPGISGLDLFSGTVFVSTDSTIAQTVNGVVLATGMPFTIEVFNSNNAQTSASGFNLIYAQKSCGQ